MLPTIFCPQCGELILDEATCPVCSWQRPRSAEEFGTIVWSTELGYQLSDRPYLSPAVAGELYCLVTEAGTIVALDLGSGVQAWERPVPAGTTVHALATDGQRLFVGLVDVRPVPSPGKSFLALDAGTGEEVWTYPTRAHSLSAAALMSTVLYFTSSDGRLHAVEAATGRRRWSVTHPSWAPAAPAVGNDIVCAGGRDTTLVAYTASDGHERWQFSASDWFASQVCVSNSAVYAQSWNGELYAIDAQTGRLLWQYRGERGRGLTTPPVATDGCVVVGSRVYRGDGDRQASGYALLALRSDDGAELWRCFTERHILTPPLVADGTIFFGSIDGLFYAVDVATGNVTWQQTFSERVVTQPQIARDLVVVGTRAGTVHAVRCRVRADDVLASPSEYLQQEAYAEAAVAYALQGQYTESAALYAEHLDAPREAALLYERAGEPMQAAALWETIDDLRRARRLYQEAGDTARLAAVLVQMGEVLDAARLYEEDSRLEEAARLYEQAGDRTKAATLYAQAGAFNRASRIWASLGEWENQVQSLLDAGRPVDAAAILEQQDQLERAAVLYEEAGEHNKALTLRVQLEHWDRVVALAQAVGDHVQEALAREQLGEHWAAADAYVRAAQEATGEETLDREYVATLYEHAAEAYSTHVFDEEQAARCRREVRRYRQLPDVAVRLKARKAFVEYEWNTLTLEARNKGFGAARAIRTTLVGPFDVTGQTLIDGLAPDSERTFEIFVRPHKDQYGPKVPLQIIVTYDDAGGRHYEVTHHVPVRVVQQNTVIDTRTPLETSIEGVDFVGPGTKGDDETGTMTVITDETPRSEYKYDVFISYSHTDEEWVRNWLLPRLEQSGLRACIDVRDFEIGLPSIVNMENAVIQSRHVVLVVTPAWVKSEWTTFEALLVQTDDPVGLRRRTLPLMLQRSKLPTRIAMLTYADFTNAETWETELQRLLRAVSTA